MVGRRSAPSSSGSSSGSSEGFEPVRVLADQVLVGVEGDVLLALGCRVEFFRELLLGHVGEAAAGDRVAAGRHRLDALQVDDRDRGVRAAGGLGRDRVGDRAAVRVGGDLTQGVQDLPADVLQRLHAHQHRAQADRLAVTLGALLDIRAAGGEGHRDEGARFLDQRRGIRVVVVLRSGTRGFDRDARADDHWLGDRCVRDAPQGGGDVPALVAPGGRDRELDVAERFGAQPGRRGRRGRIRLGPEVPRIVVAARRKAGEQDGHGRHDGDGPQSAPHLHWCLSSAAEVGRLVPVRPSHHNAAGGRNSGMNP